MSTWVYIFEALSPVIALVVAGYFFRKQGFLSEGFWQGAETLSYFVLFPALILYRLVNADFSSIPVTPLIAVVLLFFSVLTFIAWLCNKTLLPLSHATWTSFLQGSIRYNTFITLAVVDKLFGPQMFAASALIVGLFVTTANIITVTAFSIDARPAPWKVVLSLIRNPLILASIVGISLNLSGLVPPGFVVDTLSVFGRAALPIAILAVGAGLRIQSMAKLGPALTYSSLIKLVIAPLVMAILTTLLIADPVTRNVLIVFACAPTASAAYILARKLGGDAELMASIITFQTVVSTLTMSLVLLIIL